MRQWVSFGLDPDAYWQKTPRQLLLIFEGKSAQFIREHNERMSLAWHIAALPRQKKMPPLKKMFTRDRATVRRPQTAEQQWAIFGAIAEAAKVIRKN